VKFVQDAGYVNYYEVLGVPETAPPGEVRKTYKREMKRLVQEIAGQEITEARRSHYLLEMAKLNAALYILRDKDRRDTYWQLRTELMDLEQRWRDDAGKDPAQDDQYRRQFDSKVKRFLSTYVEEAVLEAGRDSECVEASHWDEAHQRHAFRILRRYRHMLYHDILERLPFYEVTLPNIDWNERVETVRGMLTASGS
jgi:curved DNA-binding protein CbpA